MSVAKKLAFSFNKEFSREMFPESNVSVVAVVGPEGNTIRLFIEEREVEFNPVTGDIIGTSNTFSRSERPTPKIPQDSYTGLDPFEPPDNDV